MVAAMSVTGIYVDEDTLLDEEPSEHGRQRIPHVALPRFGRVCRTLTNLTLALPLVAALCAVALPRVEDALTVASYRARHGLAMQQGRASLGRRALLGLDEEEHPERGGFWRALFEAERPSGRSLSEASGEGRQGRDLVESPTAAPTLAPTFAPTLAPAIEIVSTSVAQSLSAILSNIVPIFVVCYFLSLLLFMANQQMDEIPEYTNVREPDFIKPEEGQNWSWDFVLFTHVNKEDHKVDNEFSERHTMLRIVEALKNADLETCQYKSRQFDKVIIKIRATKERLANQADKINMRMRLADSMVKKGISDGQPDLSSPGDWIVYPRRENWEYKGQMMHTAIFDTENQCQYAYYEYMYGQYDEKPHLQPLYHVYPRSKSIFRSVDRIKLIMSILTWPKSDNGAGLQLVKLLKTENKVEEGLGFCSGGGEKKFLIAAAFPLHDLSELRQIQSKWLVHDWPWRQPFNHIKDYFGEKIAMYFLFLGHYSTMVLYAAIVGVVFYIITLMPEDPGYGGINSPAIPFFCVFMSLWATLFIEFWKRKQKRYSMLWGMVDIEEEEEERPEFSTHPQVVSINSPIDGEELRYYPPAEYHKKVIFSQSVIWTSGMGVFLVVVATFLLKAHLVTRSNLLDSREGNLGPWTIRNWGVPQSWGYDFASNLAPIITSLVNAAQIFLLEERFSELAEYLNELENHRTNTDYEDMLTSKVFIFQFINSFTSYIFIAFFKQIQADTPILQPFPGNYACLKTCMSELHIQLGAIFTSKVIISNLKDIGIPYVFWRVSEHAKKKRRELDAEAEADAAKEAELASSMGTVVLVGGEVDAPPPEREMSPAEQQLNLQEYHVLLGPFGDYRDLIIIYGYTVLFVAAFPLAPLFAFVNSYAQIRADAFKISFMSRRPWPSNAEDIGTWSDIIELMSYFAVVINSLIIVYTGTFMSEYTIRIRLLTFLALYHSLFFLKYTVALIVDDVPGEVEIQIKRQAFIEDKLINSTMDDELETDSFAEESKSPDVTINRQDDSVVYLDYPGFENYLEFMAPEMKMQRKYTIRQDAFAAKAAKVEAKEDMEWGQ